MTILQLSTFWIHPVLCSKVSLTNKQRVKRPVYVRVYENGGEDVGQNNRSKYGEKKAFTIRKRVMLCYVMLCYVMLCYVMLCYVMLCYVMLFSSLPWGFSVADYIKYITLTFNLN